MAFLILDSWAVVAWLRGQEPAASLVLRLWNDVAAGEIRLAMSVLNAGEVYYLTAKEVSIAHADSVLAGLLARVSLIPAPDEFVFAAAKLKAQYAISYADAFAAVTAIRARAPLVTGDPELRAIAARETTLKIQWIGQ